MHIRLERFQKAGDAVIGRIQWIDGGCFSLEDIKDIIPAGVYELKPHFGKKYQGVPRLWPDPKGRSCILIHAGNYTTDTRGCILVGTGYGKLKSGEGIVTHSQKALAKMLDALADSGTDSMEIVDAY